MKADLTPQAYNLQQTYMVNAFDVEDITGTIRSFSLANLCQLKVNAHLFTCPLILRNQPRGLFIESVWYCNDMTFGSSTTYLIKSKCVSIQMNLKICV